MLSAPVVIAILLSAVAVFFLSALIHMLFGYHNSDFAGVPNEEAVRAALRSVPPGDYGLPWPATPEARKSPEFLEKMKAGPIAFMTVRPGQAMTMGRELGLHFLFCVIVSALAAYVTVHAIGTSPTFAGVFRIAAVTSFMGYGLADWSHTIWYKRSTTTSVKNTFDALLYALATGAIFGWLLS